MKTLARTLAIAGLLGWGAVPLVFAEDAAPEDAGLFLGFSAHTDLTGTYYTGQKDSGESDAVDQFPGKPGDGWTTAWESESNASSVRNKRVRDDAPLDDGHDAYIQFESQDAAGGPTNRLVHYKRGYAAHNGFDPTRPHEVSFLYRPDNTDAFSAGGATFFEIYDGEKIHGADRTWLVRCMGAEKKFWAAWDGKKDGKFSYDNAVTSKVEVLAGHTYRITVAVNPEDRSYTVVIKDLKTDAEFKSPKLGFHSDVANCGNLFIGAQLGNKDPENATTTYTYSIDSISIRPLPAVN